MEKEIQTVLENNEKVIWEGKQDLKSTLIGEIFTFTFLFLFGLVFFLVSSSGYSGTCTINGEIRPSEDCAGVGNYIAYGIFVLSIIILIFTYLRYKVTRYIITNIRIILKSGLIGADMRSIYYDQIKSAFVNVGIVGKIFGTGTIMIDTGNIYRTRNNSNAVFAGFSNIKNPYEVYKILQDRLSNRKEGLHSGRADYESNNDEYKKFVQDTERMKRQI